MTKLYPPMEAHGRIAILIAVPPEDRSNPHNDIADAYCVAMSDDIPGGCIIYGLYHGKWVANVSGRWLMSKFIKSAEKMRDNWDCGGVDWWSGCCGIRDILERTDTTGGESE